jgi:F-type H+-transporting ATPase subunit b
MEEEEEKEEESSLIQLADFRIDGSYSPPTSSSSSSSSSGRHLHRRSTSLPSLMTLDGRRSSFGNVTKALFYSYNKLPEEPLRLSVLKLDASSFGSYLMFLFFFLLFFVLFCLVAEKIQENENFF